MPKLNVNTVGRVCVTVGNTDRAIDFYVGTLGFEKVVDVPMGPDMRWVEVALPGTKTTIALAPPPPGRRRRADGHHPRHDRRGCRSRCAEGRRRRRRWRGHRWGDPVPPMFWLRDPDGNSLAIVQPLS
jgi:catechol 2,3-dioxygenase-like lactoylglutathione lyase family enzyme